MYQRTCQSYPRPEYPCEYRRPVQGGTLNKECFCEHIHTCTNNNTQSMGSIYNERLTNYTHTQGDSPERRLVALAVQCCFDKSHKRFEIGIGRILIRGYCCGMVCKKNRRQEIEQKNENRRLLSHQTKSEQHDVE